MYVVKMTDDGVELEPIECETRDRAEKVVEVLGRKCPELAVSIEEV